MSMMSNIDKTLGGRQNYSEHEFVQHDFAYQFKGVIKIGWEIAMGR